MRLSGCLLLFLPLVILSSSIHPLTASPVHSLEAVSGRINPENPGFDRPQVVHDGSNREFPITDLSGGFSDIDRRKCGIAKEIKFLPPVKGQPTYRTERIALEEPRLRCGGTKTEDGRYALALVPQSTFSRTTAPYPTFFFYIPFTSVPEAIFSLSTAEGGQPYYEAKIQLRSERGIIRFQLPTDAPHLAVDRSYYWRLRFNIQTIDSDPPGNTWVLVMRGEIQRVQANPTLVNQLKAAPEQKRPAIYAENGFWQDALTSLAQLRRTNANDRLILADWASLLQQVDLAMLAQEPILDVTVRKIPVKR